MISIRSLHRYARVKGYEYKPTLMLPSLNTPPSAALPHCDIQLHATKGDQGIHVRLLSCRLLCSLRLKALAQNWHLYRFSLLPVPASAAPLALRPALGDCGMMGCCAPVGGASAPATADMMLELADGGLPLMDGRQHERGDGVSVSRSSVWGFCRRRAFARGTWAAAL